MAVQMSNEAVKAALLARITQEPGSTCWIWGGALDRKGYALCQMNGRQRRAARVAFQAWIAPIPRGYDGHHTCGCRNCINPAHILPMAHGEHMRLHAASGAWWGERNSQAKLTEADVQFIKVARGLLKARTLAGQFGIGVRNVQHIWSEEGWPHVGLPDFSTWPLAEAPRKAHNVLIRAQEHRRERGEPQPPHIEQYITLARVACAGH